MGINPLQQPPSYAIDIPDPAQEFLKGQITAMKMEEAMAEREAKRLALIQQQEADQKMREMLRNPQATDADWIALSTMYPVAQRAAVSKAWEAIGATKQQETLQFTGQVMHALATNPEIGVRLLEEKSAAYEARGDKLHADSYRMAAETAKKNPIEARNSLGAMIAQMPGAKDFLANLGTVTQGSADIKMQQLMAGANTVDDVFARIPALAQMGEKGIEHANKLLTQQRLREKQLGEVAEAEASKAEEKAKTLGAISMLNSLFPGAAITAEAPPTEKAAAADRPIQLAAIDGTVSDAPRGLFTLNKTGEIEGTLHLDRLLAQGKLPQMDQTKANALGISPEIQTVIMGMAQSDPKGAAKLMVDIVKGKIKQDLAPSKVPASVQEFRAYQEMTPDQQRAWREFKKAGGTGDITVNVDAKAAQKERGKEFGKFAQDAVEAAQSAYDYSSDVGLIVEMMRGMGGGPTVEAKAWFGKFMPAGTEWAKISSMGELAHTVQTKLAPTMRAAGSGATSDMEMKAYMSSIPTLATSERGRELMAKYANRIAERAQVRADIVNDIEQTGRLPSPAEIARKMKERLGGDSFLDAQDRAYFGIKGAAPQGAAPAGKATGAPATRPNVKVDY